MASDIEIVPVVPGKLWHALQDDEVVGRGHAVPRPDGRTFVAVDAWREPTRALLLAQIVDDLPVDLFTTIDENDEEQLGLLERT